MYWHELKSHYKGLIGWCFGMVFLVGAGMQKYAAYRGTGQNIADLVGKFPRAVEAIFGFNGLDLATTLGYFGTLYLYILLLAASYGAIRGADIIAKEERDKTAEFLLPKPVGRARIVVAKVAAALTMALILWAVTAAASVWAVAAYADGRDNAGAVGQMMLAVLVVMLVFLSIGVLLGALLRRSKLAVSLAAGMVLGAYVLSVLISLSSEWSWLRFLSPIAYFEAPVIVGGDRLSVSYLWLSVGIIVVALVGGLVAYRHRDL